MLRPYQEVAVVKAVSAIRCNTPGVLCLPTASGKSHVIAGICQQLDNALILAPSKELVAQNYSKLEQAFKEVAPEKVDDLGIYSAGLGRKELKPYTFATVNSVYRLGDKLKMFDATLLDEGDLMNPQKGMYKKVLESVGTGRAIALTATPFRYEHQTKYTPHGVVTRSVLRTMMNQGYFKELLINMNMKDMIDDGYITPFEYYKDSVGQYYTQCLKANSLGTDYTDESLDYYGEQTAEHVATKARRAIETGFCKKVLVFAVNIRIAERIAELAHCHCITGNTKSNDRDKWLQDFKDADTGIMVNVATLTTGVDVPTVDCIILARPTHSPRLYTQILGRGCRLDPSNPSKICKVIDETNTIEELGKVENMYIRDNQLYSGHRQLTDIPGRTITIKRRKYGTHR